MVSPTATTERACLPLGTQPLPEGPTVRRLDAARVLSAAKLSINSPSRLCIHWLHSSPCRGKILGFASAWKKPSAMNSWKPATRRIDLPRRSFGNSCGSMSLARLRRTIGTQMKAVHQTAPSAHNEGLACRRISLPQRTIMPSCSPMS